MTSALAMRSYSNSLHTSSPYSIATPRPSSWSISQARSHRLTGQEQHWSSPQFPGVVGTFAQSGAASDSVYESLSNDSWTAGDSLAASDYNDGLMSTHAPNNKAPTSTVGDIDQSYNAAFAPRSTSRDYLPSHCSLQNPPTSSDSCTSIGNHRFPPCPTSVAGSTLFSSAFSSPLTHAAEMPSSVLNYANNHLTPAQHQHFSSESQYQVGFGTSYFTSFGGAYHPRESQEGQVQAYPERSSQVQPSYRDQHSYYPSYDDRQGSIASSLSDYNRNHPTKESQGDQAHVQPTEQNTSGASPPQSASPAVTHISSPQQAQPTQEPTSPRPHGVGSTEAVTRRVGIMLRTQKRQQAKQTERSSIKPPSDGRRGKRTPTSDDSEPEEGKDGLTNYKEAYERVRLQRDFLERAASSLVHQVEMLGGDPMQASGGEDLDPKQARILITSLQRELETLREKLIRTQKELYSLRQPYDDSSRSLRGSASSRYFPMEDEDKPPLSAAPTTVSSHRRRR